MSIISAPDEQVFVDYPDLPSFRTSVKRYSAWFGIGSARQALDLAPVLQSRARLHHFQGAVCLTVNDLAPGDLVALRRVTSAVMLLHPNAMPSEFGDQGLAVALDEARFKIFVAYGKGGAMPLRRCAEIGALEYLMSDQRRLEHYPALSRGLLMRERSFAADAAPRAVFLLDLIQDFEVLRPVMLLSSHAMGSLQTMVAVTERVHSSQIWPDVAAFLNTLGLTWFKPLGPVDVAAALGNRRSLLLTASETSAPGHSFAHQCCRIASPRALRVTFQHGYECVGLRHHRAHDVQFPQGVRFASDVIFTWRNPDELPDLHPADRDKCFAVGVTKTSASRAAALLDADWSESSSSGFEKLSSHKALIVAENLHSVRFVSPQRYQEFLRFIEEIHETSGVSVVIRSHPGKRTLEKTKSEIPYTFLEGQLTADHFMASRGVVSPPSTIALDAAMCATPTAIWTDAISLGDVENYRGLPAVRRADEIPSVLLTNSSSQGLSSLRWAVTNTVALNGNPFAWHQLCQLMS